MIKFYKTLLKVNNTPAHLLLTFILSFFVMLFINLFIGSLGGIPAMLGFFMVYYMFRGMILSGRRTEGKILLENKTDIKYLIINYSIIYMIIWAVMRMVLILSKMTGWGNIKKLSLTQYMNNIYGTSMMERWAYIFAGILMFAYISSLFPLIVIRKKKNWIAYLLTDSMIYAFICFAIAAICRLFIENELEARALCLLDDMLLCRPKQLWQTSLYIISVILLALVQLIISYKISCFEFENGKDKDWKENYIQLVKGIRGKRRITVILVSSALFCSIIGSLVVYFFAPSKETVEYAKVAECLTEDSILGPMEYQNEVYIPVDLKLDFYNDGNPLGYIGLKGENCDSRFYRLAVANILYDSNGGNRNILQMYGADYNSYCKASLVENFIGWEFDTDFLIWDEQWSKESSYGSSVTGYAECSKDYIISLEKKFGAVEYKAEDFKECDAYFTIIGYKSIKQAEEAEKPYGDWVGCILVKDNIFYYGNYDNPINGVYLSTLLQILSGK